MATVAAMFERLAVRLRGWARRRVVVLVVVVVVLAAGGVDGSPGGKLHDERNILWGGGGTAEGHKSVNPAGTPETQRGGGVQSTR